MQGVTSQPVSRRRPGAARSPTACHPTRLSTYLPWSLLLLPLLRLVGLASPPPLRLVVLLLLLLALLCWVLLHALTPRTPLAQP